jgi:hypothetical protein
LVLFSLLFSINAYSANWYVDDSASGNGTSWAQAWSSPSSINWANIQPGDTIYFGAGSYGALTIGKNGTSANRIIVRAAQDTQVGVANFSSINFATYDYVTIDGGYQGARHFSTQSVSAGGGVSCISPSLRYVTINATSGGNNNDANSSPVDFRWVANGEFGYNQIDIRGSVWGAAINMVAPQHSSSYSQGKVHHNIILLPGRTNNGNGPDGIQAASGYDIYDNTIQSFGTGTGNSSQHQDQIQAYGANYLKVFNNVFIDSGDSQFDFSSGGSSQGHLHFYNNVMTRTINDMGTVGLRIYGSGALTSLTDIHIDNNTFVDCARTGSWYGAAIRVQDSGSASYSDTHIRNNIIFNCGDGWPAILIEGNPAGWNSSNNLVNAGNEGNTNISGLTNTNGQASAPEFIHYSPYSLNNNYNLTTQDASARNKGVTLSAFVTDKSGITRPQEAIWDIGAYEASAAGVPTALGAPSNLKTELAPQ